MPQSQNDDLAVLFADIVESTALYRRLGDIDALKIINACLATMKEVLPRHHGRLVKTLGDAVMCLFPDGDSAVDAATARPASDLEIVVGDIVIRAGADANEGQLTRAIRAARAAAS